MTWNKVRWENQTYTMYTYIFTQSKLTSLQLQFQNFEIDTEVVWALFNLRTSIRVQCEYK